jgi:pilus assembly protein CpaF
MQLHERLRIDGADPEPLNGFNELKNRVHAAVITALGPRMSQKTIEGDALRSRVVATIRAELESESGIAREDRDRLVTEIADEALGHGPLERLLADPTISEIMVNGSEEVFVERSGRIERAQIRFVDESHLRRIINKMVAAVGRRIDESSPMVDARLPDGSRVNAVIAPLSLSGPLVTIRKFSAKRLELQDFVRLNSLTAEAADFLTRCVQAELNILVAGGTGTGKTTMLGALSGAIPESDRIVTIEDAAELRLNQRHVLRLEARPSNIEGDGAVTIRDLVRNALRMRPDRIIVGEVRGGEALDMLQAMNTGHDGSLTTLHANTPRDALLRLETMVLMAGYDLPLRAIRQQVCSALDLVVQLDRTRDGGRRVTSITEVQRMEGEIISLQELFGLRMDADAPVGGRLAPTGLRPGLVDKFVLRGIDLPSSLFGTDAGQPRPAMSMGRLGAR